jgi:hypothetical protein
MLLFFILTRAFLKAADLDCASSSLISTSTDQQITASSTKIKIPASKFGKRKMILKK